MKNKPLLPSEITIFVNDEEVIIKFYGSYEIYPGGRELKEIDIVDCPQEILDCFGEETVEKIISQTLEENCE